jgi:hypothetical protein
MRRARRTARFAAVGRDNSCELGDILWTSFVDLVPLTAVIKREEVHEMKRRMIAVYGSMFVVALGLVILVGGLGDKIARWGGYAESLPFLGLFALFVVGHMVMASILPKRPHVRH